MEVISLYAANGMTSSERAKLSGVMDGADKTTPITVAAAGAIMEPSSEGTNGQVLTTNGNGGRTWSTPPQGVTIDDTTTASNKTWSSQKINQELQNFYATLTVTCTTQDSVTVTGQTVTVREGSSSSAPVKATLAYNGQPVSVQLAKGSQYYVSVSDTLSGHYSPTTATGTLSVNTSVILTYSDVSNIDTFAELQSALADNVPKHALCGVEIPDNFTDLSNGTTVYSNPMIVMDVRDVQDENNVTHRAAICQRKWAHTFKIPFDSPENEVATESVAASGVYYTGFHPTGTSTYSYTKLHLSAGDPIPYDSYEKVYHNSFIDTSTTGFILNGYPYYKESGIRQILNSSAGKGEWWTSTHTGDMAPVGYLVYKGYKAGCSAALLAAVKPITITCHIADVGETTTTVTDEFWLPSKSEVYGCAPNDEGTYFEQWKILCDEGGFSGPNAGNNTRRLIYLESNHATSASVLLRTKSYNSYINVINSSYGNINSNHNVSTSSYVCPACAIY